MTDTKVECFSCMDTEDMMPGLRMCKTCYSKAYDELEFDDVGNPKFKTMDEFQRFGQALEKYGTKNLPLIRQITKVTKKSSSKKKPAHPTDENRNTVANLDPELIFESRHFYVRKGDTFGQVREDAKNCKAMVNSDNTVVFYHDHHFSQPCNDRCKEM